MFEILTTVCSMGFVLFSPVLLLPGPDFMCVFIGTNMITIVRTTYRVKKRLEVHVYVKSFTYLCLLLFLYTLKLFIAIYWYLDYWHSLSCIYTPQYQRTIQI